MFEKSVFAGDRQILGLVTFSYMLVIFVLSSMQYPPNPLPATDHITTAEHVVEFAILGFLFYLLLDAKSWGSKALLLAALFAALYGTFDEIHQFFVPGRYASLLDVLADFIGGLIGASVARRI